jgi:hypothetical protein
MIHRTAASWRESFMPSNLRIAVQEQYSFWGRYALVSVMPLRPDAERRLARTRLAVKSET